MKTAAEGNGRDISCVLTVHAEGLLLHHTVRAVDRAARYAEERGLSIEVIVVMDRATPDTRLYINTSSILGARTRLISTDFGDPGLARNTAIEGARGDKVAILDGDDLISENWLHRAHEVSQTDPRYVVHPELEVFFDRETLLRRVPDQRAKDFDGSNLVIENYWSALSLARREAFQQAPYVETPQGSGFGYEDWHWNCEVMAMGWIHTVAAGTSHFIRKKQSGSRNAAGAERNLLVRHSSLFDRLPVVSAQR